MNAIKQDKHEIVYHFFQEVLSFLDKNNLYTVRFTFLRFISTMDDDASKLFLYTLYSYDKKIQELLLFQIKMDLECSIEAFINGKFKYDWEVRRHQNIENPHIITTAISCTKCDSQYDVSQVELLVFPFRIKKIS